MLMLRFAQLADHPRQLIRLTGLTLDQFQTLTHRLIPLWTQAERARLSQRPRQRAIGAGRKYRLATLEDKLLGLLVFYRFYLTDALLGWLLGVDASTVCRLQAKLEPLLEQAADPTLKLPLRQRLPPGTKKLGTWEALLQVCPEVAAVITDATEQPRQRPPRRSQRRWYSGKRRRHTVKTQLTITTAGRILQVSQSVPGRVHDYALFQRAGTARQLPPLTHHYADLGYEGAVADYPDHRFIVPVKRRRNHRVLTRAERRCNRLQARLRIVVEHVLSRLKKYQVLAQVYRHRIAGYNQRFRTIAALTNLRLVAAG
jgi:hypothetical protein